MQLALFVGGGVSVNVIAILNVFLKKNIKYFLSILVVQTGIITKNLACEKILKFNKSA